MAKHHFGIMRDDPEPHVRFDVFEPEKYHCIAADDDYIEPLLDRISDFPCFEHTTGIPAKGLIYCGITLIPPESLPRYMEVFGEEEALQDVVKLMRKAFSQNRFVIHYGI